LYNILIESGIPMQLARLKYISKWNL
jgi:hypothetical protein